MHPFASTLIVMVYNRDEVRRMQRAHARMCCSSHLVQDRLSGLTPGQPDSVPMLSFVRRRAEAGLMACCLQMLRQYSTGPESLTAEVSLRKQSHARLAVGQMICHVRFIRKTYRNLLHFCNVAEERREAYAYMLAPQSIAAGAILRAGPGASIATGNTLPLSDMPTGTQVCLGLVPAIPA